MQLQNITTSLELSKQLKEAGYPQDSLFIWIKGGKKAVAKDCVVLDDDYYTNPDHKFVDKFEIISAPTASEIWNKIPKWIGPTGLHFTLYFSVDYDNKGFQAYYATAQEVRSTVRGRTLIEVFAKMWLYLKENNLLNDTA